MKVQTKSQKMAQKAWEAAGGKDFKGFAREFPTLVHSCGLAQAFAYAKAKGKSDYREALAAVIAQAGWKDAATSADDLEREIFKMAVPAYLRLSRDALAAAVWLKRYCEADGESEGDGDAE